MGIDFYMVTDLDIIETRQPYAFTQDNVNFDEAAEVDVSSIPEGSNLAVSPTFEAYMS